MHCENQLKLLSLYINETKKYQNWKNIWNYMIDCIVYLILTWKLDISIQDRNTMEIIKHEIKRSNFIMPKHQPPLKNIHIEQLTAQSVALF